MKRLLVLAAAVALSFPALAFKQDDSQADINKEVQDRVAKKESLESIAKAASDAGVPVNPVSLALSFFGTPERVLAAMMNAGYPAAAAVNALVALGGNRDTLISTAVANGANRTTVTAGTASGAGNVGTGNVASAGFTGNAFASSPSAAIGGSGSNTSSSSVR